MNSLAPLQFKGARNDDFVVGGLLFLRWPQRHREGAETAGLRPGSAGWLGPSRSRCWCPGGVGEAAATTAHRNKSSRTCPRPFTASLRRQWWVRGGGAPVVELLYRRWSPASRRLARCMPTFCFKGAEVAEGCVGVWRLDLARLSRGGGRRRRRAQIQGRGNSGRVPGRWATNDGFFFCGSTQSLRAMGFSPTSGRAVAGAGVFRWGALLFPASIGGRNFVFIFVFLEALCASLVGQLSVSLSDILVFVCVCFP